MTDSRSLADLAVAADDAARYANAIAQFTHSVPLDVADAYRVQALSFERRVARGEQQVGMKMGLTSKAKMAQVGVDEVIWGRLSDAMIVENLSEISLDAYVHPRIEPEVAVRIGTALSGDVSASQALAAVSGVAAAAEIIDSRFENFSFALADVVADNSSSSGFIVGEWCDPSLPLNHLAMTLECDGEVVEAGASDAILGDPLLSLVEASRMAAAAGFELQPGWIVMLGGATAAVPLAAGSTYRITVESLGEVSVRVAK